MVHLFPKSRAIDPHSFADQDPDPAVLLNADPDPADFFNAVPNLNPALKIYFNFSLKLFPPGSGSGTRRANECGSMRIRIHRTAEKITKKKYDQC